MAVVIPTSGYSSQLILKTPKKGDIWVVMPAFQTILVPIKDLPGIGPKPFLGTLRAEVGACGILEVDSTSQVCARLALDAGSTICATLSVKDTC